MRTREQILNYQLYKQFQKALTEYSMLADGEREANAEKNGLLANVKGGEALKKLAEGAEEA